MALPQAQPDYNLRDVVGVVLRRLPLILLFVALFGGLGFWWADRQPPRYQAQSTLLIRPAASELGSSTSASDRQRLLANELQIIRSSLFLDEVADRVGERISVSVRRVGEEGDVVAFSKTGTDRQKITDDVNLFTNTYIAIRAEELDGRVEELRSSITSEIATIDSRLDTILAPIRELENEIDNAALGAERTALLQQRESQLNVVQPERQRLDAQRSQLANDLQDASLVNDIAENTTAELVDAATLPVEPLARGRLRSMMTGVILGALFGVGFALLRERLADRIRGVTDAEQSLGGVPVLATIPQVKNAEKPDHTDAAVLLEAHRAVQVSMGLICDPRPSVIQLTSANPGEGKSTTAANLAQAYASTGTSTLLVDADMRRPRLHERFGLDNHVGLGDLLKGVDVDPDELIDTVNEHLDVLVAGSQVERAYDLLFSPTLESFIENARQLYDVVIVDSPPLLPVADARVIGGVVDAIVLIVRSGNTERNAMKKALGMIDQTKLVGAVLNAHTSNLVDRHYESGYPDYY